MSLLHFFEKLLCTGDYLCGKSRQLCNVHAVALVNAAPDYLSQETYGTAVLVHCDTVVLHALKLVFKPDKLMVVCGKQRLAAQLLGAAYVLRHRTGYTYSVKGGRTSSDFVKYDKAVGSRVFKYIRYLAHLHHECGLSCGQVVGGSHTGEYLVNYRYPCGVGRHKASCLSHKDYQRRLTHIR